MDPRRGGGSNPCTSNLREQMGRIDEVLAWKVHTILLLERSEQETGGRAFPPLRVLGSRCLFLLKLFYIFGFMNNAIGMFLVFPSFSGLLLSIDCPIFIVM